MPETLMHLWRRLAKAFPASIDTLRASRTFFQRLQQPSSPTSRTAASPSSAISPRLLLTSLSMVGVQVCYAAQVNLGTAHLVHLGLNHNYASLAWLAGPISGLVAQPIIGLASDSCTHPLGRRRPFLITGALLAMLSLLLFSNASQLATLFHSHPSPTLPLSIAVLSFFALDFSIQAVQAPLRALVNDILEPFELPAGNACLALHCGIGNLIGGALTAVPWAQLVPAFTQVQVVFALSALVLLISTFITVVIATEKPYRKSDVKHTSPTAQLPAPTSLFSRLEGIPVPFWNLFAIQLCTWCGFFTLFVYMNFWVGQNVFHGDPNKPLTSPERILFDKGVRFGGTANAVTAAVTIAYSSMLPRLVERFGVTSMYLFSQLVEAFSLMATLFIHDSGSLPSLASKVATLVDIGLFGIVWASTISIPWTIVLRALGSDPYYGSRIGFFSTVFNASQSFPQLLVGILAPAILTIRANSADVMFVGGAVALLGAFLVFFLGVDKESLLQAGGDVETPNLLPKRTTVFIQT